MIVFNQSLEQYNTFGISVNASKFITLKSESHLINLIKGGLKGGQLPYKLPNKKVLILGSGSNILFTNDFEGIVLHPVFNHISVIDEDSESIIIGADAGVIWDDLVIRAVKSAYAGIENLSGIPGTTGAAPIQNIGAYGVELKDVLIKVRAVEMSTGNIREFDNSQCEFDYRYSTFKGDIKGQYFISKVYLKLKKNPSEFNSGYGDLDERIRQLGELNLENIRKAVLSIRLEKLPDPKIAGNAGSFFKNPVCNLNLIEELHEDHPDMPCYVVKDGNYKIPAAWLIEKCGWKGKRSGNVAVHNLQAVVIINAGNADGHQIYKFSEQIIKSVKDKFGIILEREVIII